jgi:anthranilate phosphoribosyltransferase
MPTGGQGGAVNTAYQRTMDRLLRGDAVPRGLAEDVMHATLTGQVPAVAVAAWLTAWRRKPLTAPELAGLAAVLRQRAVRLAPPEGVVLSVTGTGGSGLDTLNVSTMAALVCAAAGVKVAKPCREAGRGHCGSAEVLAHLGVKPGTPADAEAWFARGPLVWLFESVHHPELAALRPLRAALGFGTVLDALPPLGNAAGARHHLVGVAEAHLGPLILRALKTQGARRAMVVAGVHGVDEITLSGPTRFWELWDDGSTHEGLLTPEDVGLRRVPFAKVRGGGVAFNAERLVGTLKGRGPDELRALVALNAGGALYVAGAAGDVEQGVERALAVLETDAAWAVFEDVRAGQNPPEPEL